MKEWQEVTAETGPARGFRTFRGSLTPTKTVTPCDVKAGP